MIRTLVATVIAAIGATDPEASRQCIVFDDPSDYFERSDVVFLGTVTATKPTGVNGVHIITDIATFHVERIWKGPTESEFKVGDDRPFIVGSRYIVFASRNGPSTFSTAITCGWAELESKAEEKRAWLATKPSRVPD
jgi:hypothetical protein